VAVRACAFIVVAIAALLATARLGLSLAPVSVELDGEGRRLRIQVDGTTRVLVLDRPIVAVRPAAPLLHRREHQVDGSDSTNMLTFDVRYFMSFADSAYYRFQALLREEWRYSTWANLEISDLSGQVLLRQERPTDEIDISLPTPFYLHIDLERPEIPRTLELIDDDRRTLLLEINRNDKYVRLGRFRVADESDLARWYFPRDWRPPLATLFDLVARSAALALALVLIVGVLAALAPSCLSWQPGQRTFDAALPLGVAVFLIASWYVATALFDRAPHIFDAIAYLFQARTFASGALWAPPPLVDGAFPIPFSVLHEDRWFAQYPPGTAAVLALGVLAEMPWMVQPLMAAATIVLVVLMARRQYGTGTALLALLLLVTSPFVLLTAGSFLSHVPAACFASLALYALTRYVERPSAGWVAVMAIGLGLTFLTREIVTVLYGAIIGGAGLALAAPKRGRALLLDLLIGGLIVAIAIGTYLAYNAAITGNPLLLPRWLFNSHDVYGFGQDIGFYGEHTVASGLVNAEQQLVSLGFYLAGWPFGFSLGLMLLPFLTRRWVAWDVVHGSLVTLFVGAYVGEFYHGIAFGPRYYFEAVPSMIVLTARGFSALTETVGGWLGGTDPGAGWRRARQATAIVGVALLACNLVYFLPRQATLYAGFTGLPGGGPVLDQTIGHDLAGRVSRLDQALVVSQEWWFHMMYYAALNCPRLDCPTVFALGSDEETRELLRRMFPNRRWYDVVVRDGVLTIVPGAPELISRPVGTDPAHARPGRFAQQGFGALPCCRPAIG
jgi:hypothetical protein